MRIRVQVQGWEALLFKVFKAWGGLVSVWFREWSFLEGDGSHGDHFMASMSAYAVLAPPDTSFPVCSWIHRTAVAPAEAPSRLRPVWMQGPDLGYVGTLQ